MIQRIILFSFFFVVTNLYSNSVLAGPVDTESSKFQPGEMIMHHIIDSHEWHVLDWRGHSVSIPLPIILYNPDRGLDIFMSSKFNHGKDLYKDYKLDHGNIVVVDDRGKIDKAASARVLDFSITKNVFSLFFSITILLSVFLSIGKIYKNNPTKTPRGFRGLLEIMILFVRDDIARPAIGEKYYQRFLPFLLTVFFFIWLNNLLGLIPIFPGGANLTGNIAVPMIMALMVLVITTLSGKKTYWQHIFAMPGVPKPVLLILTPVEIMGLFLKPFVLMIRLFANITAGHIIILSFFSLIFIFGEINPIAGYGASVLSVGFVIFMTMLELLVAFLQAYVFTLLSAIYFGTAVEEEH
jgi:F-type H+-transporting ATPase subunit a